LLAHEALHNVFAFVDPKYLSLKEPGVELSDLNSLGMPTYRTLLGLGFWKKLVYICQAEISMDLCLKFYNREHFENIKENFLQSDKMTSYQKSKYEKW
jgi:hypothetical protein